LVAGDIGPTGEILFPLGTREPDEARDAFAAQAAALAEGGVDFFLIETMSALEEVQAAIEGIRRGYGIGALFVTVTVWPARPEKSTMMSARSPGSRKTLLTGTGASR